MNTEPFDRLDQFIADNRLLREEWTAERDGREYACLLAALSNEVADEHRADACPTALMPAWMAHLTVWMDDNPSEGHWPVVIRRYARVARGFPLLDTDAWKLCGFLVGAAIMRIAQLEKADEWGCHAANAAMIALFDRAASGEKVPQKEFDDAAAEAEQAAWAAWAAEAGQAAWAAWAAWAVEAAARAAWAAAWAAWAAEAAAWAARAAAWAAWAAEAAARAARAARADRICDAILDALESAVTNAGYALPDTKGRAT